MDEKDLKAIQSIVKKEIEPVKVDLDSVKEGLGSVKEGLGSVKVQLREIKETVDANNASLITLENTIGVYKDALDVERKRIDRHDTRLEVVEERLDLNP